MKSLSQRLNEALEGAQLNEAKMVEVEVSSRHARTVADYYKDNRNSAGKQTSTTTYAFKNENDAQEFIDDLSKIVPEGEAWLNEALNESKVSSKSDFAKYAKEVLQKAHGDKYDQKVVDKLVNDIAKKVDDDWGAAVGMLTSGLGEDGDLMNEEYKPYTLTVKTAEMAQKAHALLNASYIDYGVRILRIVNGVEIVDTPFTFGDKTKDFKNAAKMFDDNGIKYIATNLINESQDTINESAKFIVELDNDYYDSDKAVALFKKNKIKYEFLKVGNSTDDGSFMFKTAQEAEDAHLTLAYEGDIDSRWSKDSGKKWLIGTQYK